MRISKRTGVWLTAAAAAVTLILLLLDLFNVVVDFVSTVNRPPEIHEIQVSRNIVPVGETATAMVIAADPDGGEGEIQYFWAAASGRIQLDRFEGPQVTYIAPDEPGVDFITVTAYDREGATVRDFILITIKEAEEVEPP